MDTLSAGLGAGSNRIFAGKIPLMGNIRHLVYVKHWKANPPYTQWILHKHYTWQRPEHNAALKDHIITLSCYCTAQNPGYNTWHTFICSVLSVRVKRAVIAPLCKHMQEHTFLYISHKKSIQFQIKNIRFMFIPIFLTCSLVWLSCALCACHPPKPPPGDSAAVISCNTSFSQNVHEMWYLRDLTKHL